METRINRRQMIKTASTTIAAVTIVPRYVLGGPGNTPPSAKPLLAGIGVGGVGFPQLQSCENVGFHITALCDIDQKYAKHAYDKWPQARRYTNFQDMLDAEADKIDAVYCGTPDHTHAGITIAALKRKLHTLTVKPLTRTIEESRRVVEEAQKAGVATQVTASPNSTEHGCRTCEFIWDGAIGDVTEVHIWSNRPLWPQGMRIPKGSDPVPSTFDWKQWLGPALHRPYKHRWSADSLEMAQLTAPWGPNTNPDDPVFGAVYHPWNFRGWWDFGTGALGDMGCHHFNIPKRALKLGHPVSVNATASRVLEGSWPLASIVTWEFPARQGMCPVKAVWYDGGLKPSRPSELEPDVTLNDEGVLYVGTKGKMLDGRIIPEAARKKYKAPPKTLERRGGTWIEWYEAVKGGQTAACDFFWAGPLTELILLGNCAIRSGSKKPLTWDGAAGRFTNNDSANELLKANYQNGWKL